MLYDIKYCVTFGDVWYAQRILDKNPRIVGKICVYTYITVPAKNYADARAQFTHTG